MKEKHFGLPHGGSVIYTGSTGYNDENTQVIEYKLNLDSNPEFTGSVLVTFARAIGRMYDNKNWGCKTVFDIAPADLYIGSREYLVKSML